MTSIQCANCSHLASSKSRSESHKSEYHSTRCQVSFTDSEGIIKKISLSRSGGLSGDFKCPLCSEDIGTRSGIIKHVKVNCLQRPLTKGQPISSSSTQPSASQPAQNETQPGKRNYEELVLSAFGKLGADTAEKKLALALADHYELTPLCIQDGSGAEQSVLSALRTVKKFRPGEQFNTIVTPFFKIQQERALTTLPTPGLDTLVATSPLSNVLRRRTYLELSEHLCNMMNRDWEHHPALR
ncbi:hypothetical protein BGZ58_003260, partial [Dissophora ornata]